MNERKLALSYLDLNPELRNNLGIIAEEMYSRPNIAAYREKA